jgi:hypothetical protein
MDWKEDREPRLIRYKTAEFLGCHNWVYFVPFKVDRTRSSGLILPEQDTKALALCIGTGPGRWDYGRWREVNVCRAGDVVVVHADKLRAIIFDVQVGDETIYMVEDTQIAMVWPQTEAKEDGPEVRPAVVLS